MSVQLIHWLPICKPWQRTKDAYPNLFGSWQVLWRGTSQESYSLRLGMQCHNSCVRMPSLSHKSRKWHFKTIYNIFYNDVHNYRIFLTRNSTCFHPPCKVIYYHQDVFLMLFVCDHWNTSLCPYIFLNSFVKIDVIVEHFNTFPFCLAKFPLWSTVSSNTYCGFVPIPCPFYVIKLIILFLHHFHTFDPSVFLNCQFKSPIL